MTTASQCCLVESPAAGSKKEDDNVETRLTFKSPPSRHSFPTETLPDPHLTSPSQQPQRPLSFPFLTPLSLPFSFPSPSTRQLDLRGSTSHCNRNPRLLSVPKTTSGRGTYLPPTPRLQPGIYLNPHLLPDQVSQVYWPLLALHLDLACLFFLPSLFLSPAPFLHLRLSSVWSAILLRKKSHRIFGARSFVSLQYPAHIQQQY